MEDLNAAGDSQTHMMGDPDGIAAFARIDEAIYVALPHAAAPFSGVQGGAVAGLMASKIERAAPEGFQPLSIRADFLRPTPLGEQLTVSVAPLQIGRRSALFEASVSAQGRQTARATMSLVLPAPVARLEADFQLPAAPPFPDLESLPRRKTGPAPHGGPWLMDIFDTRQSEDGRMWFRWTLPLLPDGEGTPFAHAVGPADWAHGIARPGFPGPVPIACPNVEVSVHADRLPEGEWIGLASSGCWRTDGKGLGYAALFDSKGGFGLVAMGVVLSG